MTNEIILRRSPIVLIRNFAFIEIILLIAYYLSLGGGSTKADIYNSSFVATIIAYDTAKILFLSSIQFFITIYSFLNWYYEKYIIRTNTLIHEKGTFIKSRIIQQITKTPSLQLHISRWSILFRNGTIQITTQNRKPFFLRNISSYQKYFNEISRLLRAEHHEKPNIANILNATEHERLEFKSSLRYDHHTKKTNKELEKAVMKSVAAFLNSEGGKIIIGIDDAKNIVGISHDITTIQKPSLDGFENHFTQVFNAMIGPEMRHLVKLWFEQCEEKDVCIIDIAQSARPVYMRVDNNEHFFIRTGNTTTALKISQVAHYTATKWPESIHEV